MKEGEAEAYARLKFGEAENALEPHGD